MTENQRREFSSRTPTNENPEQVTYRRGFVTRHQVSGWRFVMRRIASGVALHDARMLVDPLRTQSRAVGVGALLMVTGVIGCLIFSWIRPGGVAGDEAILADRSSTALYVRVGDYLHPVLNLTSARLIAGAPDDPKMVKSQELDRLPRGNLVGIPGAPERMVQNQTRDANWTVCDGEGAVTVIAGVPEPGSSRAAELPDRHGVLVGAAGATWLLWDGRRSRIDLADTAVTSALGLGVGIDAPQEITDGLFNAIPEAPELAVPSIPDAGQPTAYPLAAPAPIGAVITAYAPDSTLLYYAVMPDGLQPVSGVLAAMLRNNDSYGLQAPPRLSADEVARLPVSSMIDTSRYPSAPITLVDRAAAPVTCVQWSQPAGATTADVTLLSGSVLPLADSARTIDLVSAGSGGTANRVALPRGTGFFVKTSGAGAQFWVSDTGVRYGIDDGAGGPATSSTEDGSLDTVEALGLSSPALPIPSSVLSLFAPGPTLSRADALIAHDGLAPDLAAGRRIQETR